MGALRLGTTQLTSSFIADPYKFWSIISLPLLGGRIALINSSARKAAFPLLGATVNARHSKEAKEAHNYVSQTMNHEQQLPGDTVD